MSSKPPSIFISSSPNESVFVDRLEADLRSYSIVCWVGRRNIGGGQVVGKEQEKAIEHCQACLVVITPQSMESGEVRSEYDYANSLNKPIIPLIWRQAKIPLALQNIKPVNFQINYQEGLNDLLNSLRIFEISATPSQRQNHGGVVPPSNQAPSAATFQQQSGHGIQTQPNGPSKGSSTSTGKARIDFYLILFGGLGVIIGIVFYAEHLLPPEIAVIAGGIGAFLLVIAAFLPFLGTRLQSIWNTTPRFDKIIGIVLSFLIALLLIFTVLGNSFILSFLHGTHTSTTPSPTTTLGVLTVTPVPSVSPLATAVTSTTHPLLPPTLVQKQFQTKNSPNVVSFSSNVGAGSLIIVAITQWVGMISSVTDNQGNTYFPVRAAINATPVGVDNNPLPHDYVELYYAPHVTGGSTTVTVISTGPASPSGVFNVGIYEYSGLAKSSPLDSAVENKGTGETPNGGTLQTTTQNELCFAVGVDDNGANLAPSPGSGYILEDEQEQSGNGERFYTEDRFVSSGSCQANFSISQGSGVTYWAVIGAAFKS